MAIFVQHDRLFQSPSDGLYAAQRQGRVVERGERERLAALPHLRVVQEFLQFAVPAALAQRRTVRQQVLHRVEHGVVHRAGILIRVDCYPVDFTKERHRISYANSA